MIYLIFKDTGEFGGESDDDEDLDVDYFSTGDSDYEDETPDFESMWSLPAEDEEVEEGGYSLKVTPLVATLKRMFLSIANGLSFETRRQG